MTYGVCNIGALLTASGVSVAANAAIAVRRESDGALATIFSDDDGNNAISQPGFVTDANGAASFYAAARDLGYQVTVTKGAETLTWHNVPIGTAQYLDYGALGKSLVQAVDAVAARDLLELGGLALLDEAEIAGMVGDPGFRILADADSNGLTLRLKNRAGDDPSAAAPVTLAFRSATLADGDVDVLTIDAAQSLSIPHGATLGTSNDIAFRGWVLGFNDADTFKMAVVNCLGTDGVLPLNEDELRQASAIGTGSDAAQTVYASSAVSADAAVRVLGYFDYSDGLDAAGTYDIDPTKVHTHKPGEPLPGQTVQEKFGYSETGSATSSTSMTDVTNGSLAITPKSKCNPVLAQFAWHMTNVSSFASEQTAFSQVLRGSTNLSGSDGFRTSAVGSGTGVQTRASHSFCYLDTPRSTSAQTYKLQHRGSSSQTVTTAYISKRLTEVMG